MTNKRWAYKPVPSKETVAIIATALNINDALATLLAQRSLYDFEDAKAFFRPSLDMLHDPFLMKDMDKAIARLQAAIQKQEKILIYGDYDVDGTTSVALLYSFLKKRYDNLGFYIPDRYTEGYGISKKSINFAKENNFALIIALDCGIKSNELVAYAKGLDVDFIICDHHRPGDEVPQAAAVLDPKRNDCSYPFDELSGCGVGFKLMHAYCLENKIPLEELFDYLDLLAISIAADLVPIIGENRIFTYYGLQKINNSPRPGIKSLIDIAGFKNSQNLTITNVVFGLGPRINAAGRIDHGSTAVKLLIAEDAKESDQYAEQVNKNNLDRRGFDTTITEEALEMIKQSTKRGAKTTVLFKNTWHKGVIGIVASRCIERYHRPTIILTESDNKATGSARSVEGFDVYEAIEACAELLEQYGGHKHAAGLTLKLENVSNFQEKFEQVVASKITQEALIPQIDVDLELQLTQIDAKFYRILKQLAPFGPGNMHPMFVSKNVQDDYGARIVGADKRHLKLKVKQADSPTFDAIGFDMARHFDRIAQGEKFHICYHVEENYFNGITTLQLVIKDIKFDKE